jgi:hypothetical protein
MQNDTRIAVDPAKTVFEIAVSYRPGRVGRRESDYPYGLRSLLDGRSPDTPC